jgi:hypothetical protein
MVSIKVTDNIGTTGEEKTAMISQTVSNQTTNSLTS